MGKEKIGLYFGSFNPIHNGHLTLADYILKNTELEKIWFVVSPQNPLKSLSSLLDNKTRLDLVKLAIEGNDNFIASDVEFFLSYPSYTINTLNYLSNKYPQKDFSLIIGQDNLVNFPKWRDYQKILSSYNIYVYPRKDCSFSPLQEHPSIHLLNSPLLDISATQIRELIKKGKAIQGLLPDNVCKEVEEKNLYK